MNALPKITGCSEYALLAKADQSELSLINLLSAKLFLLDQSAKPPYDGLRCGPTGDVYVLVWIALMVKEHRHALAVLVPLRVQVAFSFYGFASTEPAECGLFPLPLRITQNRSEACTVKVIRFWQSGQVADRRIKIDKFDQRTGSFILRQTRCRDDQRSRLAVPVRGRCDRQGAGQRPAGSQRRPAHCRDHG